MWLLSFIFISGLNHGDFLEIQKNPVGWDKNPFVKDGQAVKLDELSLLGVVYSKERSAALINDQVVQVGDKLGAFEIVSISKNEVVLRGESGVFKLNLKRVKK